jgi:hypothetical protein
MNEVKTILKKKIQMEKMCLRANFWPKQLYFTNERFEE